MNKTLTIAVLCCLVAACGKDIEAEKPDNSKPGADTVKVADPGLVDEFKLRADRRNYYPVHDVLDFIGNSVMSGDNDWVYEPYKYTVWVKAMVVGSTERTMNNAIYKPPFKGTTAWIVADSPDDDDDYLLPVRIADTQTFRRDFNLPDNPRFWLRTVYICGGMQPYMGRPAIYHVLSILEEEDMMN